MQQIPRAPSLAGTPRYPGTRASLPRASAERASGATKGQVGELGDAWPGPWEASVVSDEIEGWVWLHGDVRRRRLDGAETFLVDGRWRVRNPLRGKVAVGPTGEF